jgi:hypothetical protein
MHDTFRANADSIAYEAYLMLPKEGDMKSSLVNPGHNRRFSDFVRAPVVIEPHRARPHGHEADISANGAARRRVAHGGRNGPCV